MVVIEFNPKVIHNFGSPPQVVRSVPCIHMTGSGVITFELCIADIKAHQLLIGPTQVLRQLPHGVLDPHVLKPGQLTAERFDGNHKNDMSHHPEIAPGDLEDVVLDTRWADQVGTVGGCDQEVETRASVQIESRFVVHLFGDGQEGKSRSPRTVEIERRAQVIIPAEIGWMWIGSTGDHGARWQEAQSKDFIANLAGQHEEIKELRRLRFGALETGAARDYTCINKMIGTTVTCNSPLIDRCLTKI